MKKVLLTIVAVLTLGLAANAQNNLGLRFETGNGGSAELSFQHGMGSSNRLELDLGWGENDAYSHFQLAGIYQWTGTITGNLDWYAGVGARLGLWNNRVYDESDFWLGIAGQVGAEYNFQKVPIQISLDWRPLVEVIGPQHDGLYFYGGNIGLGVRYRF